MRYKVWHVGSGTCSPAGYIIWYNGAMALSVNAYDYTPTMCNHPQASPHQFSATYQQTGTVESNVSKIVLVLRNFAPWTGTLYVDDVHFD